MLNGHTHDVPYVLSTTQNLSTNLIHGKNVAKYASEKSSKSPPLLSRNLKLIRRGG